MQLLLIVVLDINNRLETVALGVLLDLILCLLRIEQVFYFRQ